MKKCNKCNTTKNKSCFYSNKTSKDGLYSICKTCKKEINKNWKHANQKKEKNNNAVWYQKNKRKVNAKRILYKNNNIQIKLALNLRSRLNKAIKKDYKIGSAVRDLGCSIEELKKHLESKFKPGMSWDNYGQWHIDHVKPLSKFDLINYNELKKACHYSNLQPMWAKDNLSKNNRYIG